MSYGNGYTESGEASATTANITKPGLKVSNSSLTNKGITATATFTAKSGAYTGLTWQVDKGDGKWVTVTTSPYAWTVSANCTIKARQYDASGNGQDNSRVATVTVTNIDKVGPTITSVSFTKADDKTAYTCRNLEYSKRCSDYGC